MNNGRTKESLSSTAVIEDIEEATFTAFCEFAYHGRYKTLSRGDKGNEDDLSADGKDFKRIRGPVHLPEYLTRHNIRSNNKRKGQSQNRNHGLIIHLSG